MIFFFQGRILLCTSIADLKLVSPTSASHMLGIQKRAICMSWHNPLTPALLKQGQAELCESEASLIDTGSSTTARTIKKLSQ